MASDIKPEQIRDALAEQRDLELEGHPDERSRRLPPVTDYDDEDLWANDLSRSSVSSQDRPSMGGVRRVLIPVLIGGAALLAVAAAALVAIKVIDDGDEPREVAVIEAETTPEKVKPEEPGGMEVAHQDALVLNETTGPDGEKQVEQLLPPPEEPMSRGDVATAAQQQDAAAPLVVPGQEPTFESQASPQTAGAGQAGSQVAAVQPEADRVVPAQFGGSPFAIQFASLRTRDRAEALWRQLQRRYPDLLGDMALNVDQVDLGNRGIFFRVQAGPLPNRATAADMCGQLKARQQDCIVVAR